MSTYRELLMGCGHKRDKRVIAPGTTNEWQNLVTLDRSRRAKPDVVCDLNCFPWGRNVDGVAPTSADYLDNLGPHWWAFRDNAFNEVHAYEVLEHFGQQGDFVEFLRCFEEVWRILTPGGYLCATCPSRFSGWFWGDPGHTRAVLPESLTFVSQANYTAQCGVTAMSDYRDEYRGDFNILVSDESDRKQHIFILQAVKPARNADHVTNG